MMVIGNCFCCGTRFSFNAELVPSIPINPNTGKVDHVFGEWEPICRTCIERANEARVANGDEPWVTHKDAYEPQEVA